MTTFTTKQFHSEHESVSHIIALHMRQEELKHMSSDMFMQTMSDVGEAR